jgi:YHS domain-containing protein
VSPEPPRPDQPGDAQLPATAVDPVCGMTVAPAVARARDLSSTAGDATFYFCGRGCKLDFEDDPGHYLDPGYVPTM